MQQGLSAVLKARASYSSSIDGSIDASDGKQGAEHAPEALTGQKTSRDREHVHVVGRRAPLHPNFVNGGPDGHSDGEGSLWKDEPLDCVVARSATGFKRTISGKWTDETDGIPVGNVRPILLGDPEVLSNDGENSSNRQSDGGISRGGRNWEFRA